MFIHCFYQANFYYKILKDYMTGLEYKTIFYFMKYLLVFYF